MFKIKSNLKVGKIPDFNGKKYGKLQVTSKDLAEHVGQNLEVIVFVLEPNEILVSDNFDEKEKIAAIEWKVQVKEK